MYAASADGKNNEGLHPACSTNDPHHSDEEDHSEDVLHAGEKNTKQRSKFLE